MGYLACAHLGRLLIYSGVKQWKAFLYAFLLSIVLNVSVPAQKSSPASSQSHRAEAGRPMSVLGIVSERGNTLRFVTDQRVWNVDNPETLEGHEGHYIRVEAYMYSDKGTIHITSVMIPTKLEIRTNDLR
jgi:hypothetical protein